MSLSFVILAFFYACFWLDTSASITEEKNPGS